MENIKNTIYLIGVGLTIGFTLIVYAHASFATKDEVRETKAAVQSYKSARDREIDQVIDNFNKRMNGLETLIRDLARK